MLKARFSVRFSNRSARSLHRNNLILARSDHARMISVCSLQSFAKLNTHNLSFSSDTNHYFNFKNFSINSHFASSLLHLR